uniref:Uncharacterized protein n=1 Tax=Mycena chlorophos TaxID=658473 RepID=A0ABQ0KXW2_MYCCL|nr:predicted protein [Mycena chlorophos]
MHTNGDRMFFTAIFRRALLNFDEATRTGASNRFNALAQVLKSFKTTVTVLSFAPSPGLNLLFGSVKGKTDFCIGREPADLVSLESFIRHLGFDQAQVRAIFRHFGADERAVAWALENLDERYRVPYGPDRPIDGAANRLCIYPRKPVIDLLNAWRQKRGPAFIDHTSFIGHPTLEQWQWNIVTHFFEVTATFDRSRHPHTILSTMVGAPGHPHEIPNAVGATLWLDADDVDQFMAQRSVSKQSADPLAIVPNLGVGFTELFCFKILRAMGACEIFVSADNRVVAKFVHARMAGWTQKKMGFNFTPRWLSIYDVENDPTVEVATWFAEEVQAALDIRNISLVDQMWERDIQFMAIEGIVGRDYNLGVPGASEPLMEVAARRKDYYNDPSPVEHVRFDGVKAADTRIAPPIQDGPASYTFRLFELKVARPTKVIEGTLGIDIFRGENKMQAVENMRLQFKVLPLENWVLSIYHAHRHMSDAELAAAVDAAKYSDRDWNGVSEDKSPLTSKTNLDRLQVWYTDDVDGRKVRRRSPVKYLILRAMQQCRQYAAVLRDGKLELGSENLLKITQATSTQRAHRIVPVVLIVICGVAVTFEMDAVETRRIYRRKKSKASKKPS